MVAQDGESVDRESRDRETGDRESGDRESGHRGTGDRDRTMKAYLQALEKELKGFPQEGRAALLEEIRSHIESGESDPNMGKTEAERRQKLAREMGSPQDLGQGFHSVHRPNRLLDYLILVIPSFVLFPLANLVFYNPALDYPDSVWYEARAICVLSALLIFAGVWRRSTPLKVYWITATLGAVISLMTREQRWLLPTTIYGNILESLAWYVALIGLTFWLGKTLLRNRHDFLLITFALLPLLLAGADYSSMLIALHDKIQVAYPQWVIRLPVGAFGLIHLIDLLWPALFFLSPRRSLRWLAVALNAASLFLFNTIAFWQSSLTVAVWVLYLGFVVLGYLADRAARSSRALEVREG